MNCIIYSMVCKTFLAQNSPIFRKSRGEKEHGENWQMQSVLLSKQTQIVNTLKGLNFAGIKFRGFRGFCPFS